MNAGSRYSTTFAKVLAEMKDDEIHYISRGAFILELLDRIIKLSKDTRSLIATEVFSKLESCLPAEKEQSTSNGANKKWLLFHKLCFSEDMQTMKCHHLEI